MQGKRKRVALPLLRWRKKKEQKKSRESPVAQTLLEGKRGIQRLEEGKERLWLFRGPLPEFSYRKKGERDGMKATEASREKGGEKQGEERKTQQRKEQNNIKKKKNAIRKREDIRLAPRALPRTK